MRPLSTTAPRPRKRDEDEEEQELEEDERVFENYGEVYAEFLRSETMTEAEKAEAKKAMEMWEQLPIEEKNKITQNVKDIREGIHPLRRTQRPIKGSFWNDEERDSEMITNEFGEDDFEEDDITGMGHAKLEEHREMREYARIAVWEMPLLSSESRLSLPLSDRKRTDLPAQNSPSHSNLHPANTSSASVTRRTWVNSTPQRRRLWCSSVPPTWGSRSSSSLSWLSWPAHAITRRRASLG